MEFDIVIVGGGLSGLALAAALSGPAFSTLRVLVLDQRKSYTRDRTWSYWKIAHDAGHRYSHLERQQWGRWCVRQAGCAAHHMPKTVTRNGKTTSYCTLDGDHFYLAAQHLIAQSSHVELRLGMTVQNIVDGNNPSVTLTGGEVIRATWMFDARPFTSHTAHTLVQQFMGYEIKTDRDVFDPTAVELMDFQPSTDGLHFFYVLPYSPRAALIETTWISPASVKPDFMAELTQFIAAALGSATYEVVYEERGSLALSLSDSMPGTASRIVPLGRRAGTLRASTGYAFLETLEHMEKIAASLESILSTGELKNWRPVVFKRRALDTWMDTVFLTVLERDWGKGPGYFMQLFERLDADIMVAFLSGRATWRQRLSVALALPALPFAAQALSTLFGLQPKFPGDRR